MKSFKLELILILELLSVIFSNSRQTNKECIILNKEYSEGFLYLFKGFYTPLFYHAPKYFTDELPTTCDLPLSQCKKVTCKCVKENCCHKDIVEAGQWFLKHVPDKSNTYFIQSKYNKKYLCAKKNYFGDFLSNLLNERDTEFSSLNDVRDEAFMWELKKQPNGWYEIWNVKYHEPLYAFLNGLFTWKHAPDSDKYQWNFKCRDGPILQ